MLLNPRAVFRSFDLSKNVFLQNVNGIYKRLLRTTPCLAALNMNPYTVLGVNKNSSEKDIKSAYFKLVKKYHPDQNKSPEASKKFKEVKEAYDILKDPSKKSMYDQTGSTDFSQDGSAGDYYGGYSQPNDSDYQSFFTGNDFFSSLFNGGGFGSSQNSQSIYQSEIKVDFVDAMKGYVTKVTVNIDKDCTRCHGKKYDPTHGSYVTCKTCNGSGNYVKRTGNMVMKTMCGSCYGTGKVIKKYCTMCLGSGKVPKKETISINVPAGIDDGTTLRHQEGSTIIDFIINIRPSDEFWRKGRDIHSYLKLNFLEAFTGGTVRAKTINGFEEVKVEPGTSSHATISLPGKGVQSNRYGRGSHIFHVQILVPKTLNATQKASLGKILKDVKTV